MRIPKKALPALVGLAGLATLWAGCSLMPKEEPVPDELAIFFTASTGGEIEPCG